MFSLCSLLFYLVTIFLKFDFSQSQSGPYVQQVTKPFEYSSRLFWDYRVQLLYFIDLHKGSINSLNPLTNEINSIHFDGDVRVVTPTKILNKFIIGNNNSLVTFYWNGKNNSVPENLKILSSVDSDKPENRFSDGKADKYGRLWWITSGPDNVTVETPNPDTLFKITNKYQKTEVIKVTETKISNGFVWTKDNTKIYFTDTAHRIVVGHDFDIEKGVLTNREIVFDLNDYSLGGIPSELTIDEEDNLFIALFNGGQVIKINPKTGKLLQQIALPASRITSCMFGGTNLDILFVSSSSYRLSEAEQTYESAAGAIFAITGLQTRGRNMYLAAEF